MRRSGIPFLLALLVAAACGGDGDQTGTSVATSTTSGGDPGGSTTVSALDLGTVTEWVIGDDGEILEVEETVAAPATLDALLDFGIDAGLWDELGGLELLLGYAVGAVPASAVPGAEGIIRGEFTELLERANELAIAGEHSEDELAEVRRWFELAVPGPETIAMLADTSRRVGVPGFRSFMGAGSTCAPVDPEDFSDWAVIEGCYLMYEASIEGVTLRVFFPDWYLQDEFFSDLPRLALDALAKSAQTFSPLARIGDMDVIFSLVTPEDVGEREVSAVANDDATWGEATRAGTCPITVFPGAFSSGFQHTIAHEAWHCVQRENGYPRGVEGPEAWIVEGGAEYFASLVYPNSQLWDFDRASVNTAVWDMKYAAWVWWQFLGNHTSPRSVADLQEDLVHAPDGGRSAMAGYGEMFERFVIEYVAGVIADAHGSTFPKAYYTKGPNRTVTKDDTGAEYEFFAGAFVAMRQVIIYDEQLRVVQSEESFTGGRHAMVKWQAREVVAEWRSGIYPEVGSTCEDKIAYVVVPTVAVHTETHSVTVRILEIEEGEGDLDANTGFTDGVWEGEITSTPSDISAGPAFGMQEVLTSPFTVTVQDGVIVDGTFVLSTFFDFTSPDGSGAGIQTQSGTLSGEGCAPIMVNAPTVHYSGTMTTPGGPAPFDITTGTDADEDDLHFPRPWHFDPYTDENHRTGRIDLSEYEAQLTQAGFRLAEMIVTFEATRLGG